MESSDKAVVRISSVGDYRFYDAIMQIDVTDDDGKSHNYVDITLNDQGYGRAEVFLYPKIFSLNGTWELRGIKGKVLENYSIE